MDWQVYMVRCTDGSLYTGITTDIERRLAEHSEGRGAKYFRGRAPEKLVYLEVGHTRSSASRREVSIKRLQRDEKWRLITSSSNGLAAAGMQTERS